MGGAGKPGRVLILSDERRLRDMANDAGFTNLVVRINERNRWRYGATSNETIPAAILILS